MLRPSIPAAQAMPETWDCLQTQRGRERSFREPSKVLSRRISHDVSRSTHPQPRVFVEADLSRRILRRTFVQDGRCTNEAVKPALFAGSVVPVVPDSHAPVLCSLRGGPAGVTVGTVCHHRDETQRRKRSSGRAVRLSAVAAEASGGRQGNESGRCEEEPEERSGSTSEMPQPSGMQTQGNTADPVVKFPFGPKTRVGAIGQLTRSDPPPNARRRLGCVDRRVLPFGRCSSVDWPGSGPRSASLAPDASGEQSRHASSTEHANRPGRGC